LTTDLLNVADIVKTYGDRTVLNGVSFSARPGDSVAIVGPSGSGKSTVLNLVGSLDKPTSGTITLGDTVVTSLAGPALVRYRGNTIGFVFQDHHLLPQLTALENVLLPTIAIHAPGNEKRARSLLCALGVDARAGSYPKSLSGGERQRVSVARALINKPKMLLCDEPTGSLDHATGENVLDAILSMAKDEDAIVIMVTHNTDHAQRCGRGFRMQDGKLVEIPGRAARK
jgi:ABC-type lipoprotein export system ATPase subunit